MSSDNQSSKDKVLAKWPDAELVEFHDGAHAVVSRGAKRSLGYEYIGWGQTTCRKDCVKATAEAWDDAASKLPQPEPPRCPACKMGQSLGRGEGTHLEGTVEHPTEPPSPAGEIAMKEMHKCPHCGAECGCPREENHCWHECAVPEPVSPEVQCPICGPGHVVIPSGCKPASAPEAAAGPDTRGIAGHREREVRP